MKYILSTYDKLLCKGEASSIIFPTSEGQVAIKNNHAPIIIILSKGILKIYLLKESLKKFYIQDGFAKVENNEISLLVNKINEK